MSRRDWEGVPVVVTTSRRIFCGLLDLRDIDAQARCVRDFQGARNALRPDTTKGVCQVAVEGPGPNASIEMASDIIVLMDVCVVRPCTEVAFAKWQDHPVVGT